MADKATWWSITEFDEEYMAILEDANKYPDWVAKVYGGREKCPDTQRIHFQGAIQCHGQHRFGKIKGWLPKAHIEAAKSAVALKKYAMKEETAISEKKEFANPKKFLDAQAVCRLITSKVVDRQTDRQAQFWLAVQALIVEDPGLTGQLMNPSLKNFWVKTCPAWYTLLDKEGCDSITHIPAGCVDEDCDRDTYWCKFCYDQVYNGAPDEESVSQESGSEAEGGGKEEGSSETQDPYAPGRPLHTG